MTTSRVSARRSILVAASAFLTVGGLVAASATASADPSHLQRDGVQARQVESIHTDPGVQSLGDIKLRQIYPVSWTISNHGDPITVFPKGDPIGNTRHLTATIAQGATQTHTVDVPAATTRLDVYAIPTDTTADLEVVIKKDGRVVAIGQAFQHVRYATVDRPSAGRYVVEVTGKTVSGGSTEYAYDDTFFNPRWGVLFVPKKAIKLEVDGQASLRGWWLALARPVAGRALLGELTVRNARGAPLDICHVMVDSITG